MTTNILIAFDGTGSTDWKRKDGLNSHVHRFYESFITLPEFKKYLEGPSTAGFETGPTTSAALGWLSGIAHKVAQKDAKICIVGHSRGCSSAIQLANQLNSPSGISPFVFTNWKLPIEVAYLGLYDAVDRDVLSSGDTGMGLRNVKSIRHAFRSNQKWTGSRPSFSNISISATHERSAFDCSHGGIGGDPGFFEDLNGFAIDSYCNAWTTVLSKEELMFRFGVIRYTQNDYLHELKGEVRQKRIDDLRKFYNASRQADDFIRVGARAEGFVVGSALHIPCQSSQDPFWQRLERMIGAYSYC